MKSASPASEDQGVRHRLTHWRPCEIESFCRRTSGVHQHSKRDVVHDPQRSGEVERRGRRAEFPVCCMPAEHVSSGMQQSWVCCVQCFSVRRARRAYRFGMQCSTASWSMSRASARRKSCATSCTRTSSATGMRPSLYQHQPFRCSPPYCNPLQALFCSIFARDRGAEVAPVLQ